MRKKNGYRGGEGHPKNIWEKGGVRRNILLKLWNGIMFSYLKKYRFRLNKRSRRDTKLLETFLLLTLDGKKIFVTTKENLKLVIF